ncbi:expressed unknown protein [Seminavis robusta]|uniref:Uncharacterized protein n=1 Tax=Seminavis robusta TaxID=568900 RepID=A0A9N8DP22_9STRA|nr:expressed unknown protein [Seminavis robusta]|eukprot:Sro238_g095510.1 n/a (178) ;mRNA; f:28722-29255
MGNEASSMEEISRGGLKRTNSAPSLTASVSSMPSLMGSIRDLHFDDLGHPTDHSELTMSDRSRSSLGSSFSRLCASPSQLTANGADEDESGTDERRRRRRRKNRASTGDPRKDGRRRSNSSSRLSRSLNSTFVPKPDLTTEFVATGEFLEKLMETPEGRAKLKSAFMDKKLLQKVGR